VQPCLPPRFIAVRLTEIGGVGELAIDRGLHSVPEYVGD
jgi:hypothetical protein